MTEPVKKLAEALLALTYGDLFTVAVSLNTAQWPYIPDDKQMAAHLHSWALATLEKTP